MHDADCWMREERHLTCVTVKSRKRSARLPNVDATYNSSSDR